MDLIRDEHEKEHNRDKSQDGGEKGGDPGAGREPQPHPAQAQAAADKTDAAALSDEGRASLARQSAAAGAMGGVQRLAGDKKGDSETPAADADKNTKKEDGDAAGVDAAALQQDADKDEAASGGGAAGGASVSVPAAASKRSGGGSGGGGGSGVRAAQTQAGPTQQTGATASKASGGDGGDDGGGAAAPPQAPDIDFVAREYAFHEAWQQVPDAEKNEIVTTVGMDGADGLVTIPLEERQRLLNQATGRGVGAGAVQLAVGEGVKLAIKQGAKVAAKKGLGKALPGIGLVFAGYELYSKISGNNIGKSLAVLSDPTATDIDRTIAKLCIAKDVLGILGAVVGVAAGICAVIAALTSWTLVGGVSFGAAAIALTAVSVALSLAEVAIDAILVYQRRQKVLQMEGNPEDVLKAIAEYQSSVTDVTKGSVTTGRQAASSIGDVRGLQVKTRTDAETIISQDRVKASASGTTVRTYEAGSGNPSSVTQNSTRVVSASSTNVNHNSQTVTSRNLVGGGQNAPRLEAHQSSTTISARQVTLGQSTTTSAHVPGSGPVGAASISHRSSSVELSSTRMSHTSSSNRVVGTGGYDMLNRNTPELRDPKDLVGTVTGAIPSDLKKAPLSIAGQGKTKPVTILARNEAGIATDDPNTIFVPDAGGQGQFQRRLPLTPMPAPPHVLPEVAERARVIGQLTQKEEMLAGLLGESKTAQQKMDHELSPAGGAAQWQQVHEQMSQSLEGHRDQLGVKEGRAQEAEGLLGQMAAEDQKAKGKSGEVLQSREVDGVASATSNSFLRGAVNVGGGVAKAGAAVVNGIGKLFGKKEPVVDTRAIDNVRSLFRESPKMARGKGGLAGQSGEMGNASAPARQGLADKKAKIAQGKGQHATAQGKTGQLGNEIQNSRGIMQEGATKQREWVAKVQQELEETRAARQAETAAFEAEMGMMKTWSAQHFEVRQLNQAVVTSAHQLPQRNELDEASRSEVDQANSAVDGALGMIETKKGELAGEARAAGANVQTQSGAGLSGEYATAVDEAVARFGRRLDQHKDSLAAAKASLATVNPDQIGPALEAVGRVVRAIQVSVNEYYGVYAGTIQQVAQAAIEFNIEEEERRRQMVAGL
jgi:hypothetical protein